MEETVCSQKSLGKVINSTEACIVLEIQTRADFHYIMSAVPVL